MSKTMKLRREDEFRLLCRERGVPLTAQRRTVMKAVLELGSHPTADEVFASDMVRKAGVSRATVYRTLDGLAGMGAVIKIGHGGNAIRYDGRIELHHHLVCLRCNAITDFSSDGLDAIRIPNAAKFGFVVKGFHVQLSGLCRQCLKETKQMQQGENHGISKSDRICAYASHRG